MSNLKMYLAIILGIIIVIGGIVSTGVDSVYNRQTYQAWVHAHHSDLSYEEWLNLVRADILPK